MTTTRDTYKIRLASPSRHEHWYAAEGEALIASGCVLDEQGTRCVTPLASTIAEVLRLGGEITTTRDTYKIRLASPSRHEHWYVVEGEALIASGCMLDEQGTRCVTPLASTIAEVLRLGGKKITKTRDIYKIRLASPSRHEHWYVVEGEALIASACVLDEQGTRCVSPIAPMASRVRQGRGLRVLRVPQYAQRALATAEERRP